jgi:cytochrome oxidase Cu insertion factor (SCO1/SenC/PrrC family)
MSRIAVCSAICTVLTACVLGLTGARAQTSKQASEVEEAYQQLKQKWEEKLQVAFTRDEVRRGIDRFWNIRAKAPGSEVAVEATIEAFRLLEAGSPIFIERGSTKVRLSEVKYSQIGPDDPAKGHVLRYVPSFSKEPVEEWRRVAEQSSTSSVQQAALFHIASRYHTRNHYDQASDLLDTLSVQYGVTKEHSRYGDRVAQMRQEIEQFRVGTRIPSLRASALTGDSIDTAKMQGTVRLLFFYGSTCGTCVEKYPILNRLYQKYDRTAFRLVGIPADPDTGWMTKSEFQSFMEEYGINWPQTWEEGILDEYNIGALGTGMLLDRTDKLVWLGRSGEIDATKKLAGYSLPRAVAELLE